MPWRPPSQPKPPPSVRPAPPVVASPNACVSRSNSDHRSPGSARAVCAAWSTRRLFISEKSMTMPSSQVQRPRSEEHTSELQSRQYLVCRLLLEKKKTTNQQRTQHRKKTEDRN